MAKRDVEVLNLGPTKRMVFQVQKEDLTGHAIRLVQGMVPPSEMSEC